MCLFFFSLSLSLLRASAEARGIDIKNVEAILQLFDLLCSINCSNYYCTYCSFFLLIQTLDILSFHISFFSFIKRFIFAKPAWLVVLGLVTWSGLFPHAGDR